MTGYNSDLLLANEKLYKSNQKLLEDKNLLRSALQLLKNPQGCFCTYKMKYFFATDHTDRCKIVSGALEATGK